MAQIVEISRKVDEKSGVVRNLWVVSRALDFDGRVSIRFNTQGQFFVGRNLMLGSDRSWTVLRDRPS